MIRIACTIPELGPPANHPFQIDTGFAIEREVTGVTKGAGNVGTGERQWDARTAAAASSSAGPDLLARLDPIAAGKSLLVLDDETPLVPIAGATADDIERARRWRSFAITQAALALNIPVAACWWSHPLSAQWGWVYGGCNCVAVMCFPRATEPESMYLMRARTAIEKAEAETGRPALLTIGDTTGDGKLRVPIEAKHLDAAIEAGNGDVLIAVTPDRATYSKNTAAIRAWYDGWWAGLAGVGV